MVNLILFGGGIALAIITLLPIPADYLPIPLVLWALAVVGLLMWAIPHTKSSGWDVNCHLEDDMPNLYRFTEAALKNTQIQPIPELQDTDRLLMQNSDFRWDSDD